jgi:hypothetical protein
MLSLKDTFMALLKIWLEEAYQRSKGGICKINWRLSSDSVNERSLVPPKGFISK